MPLSGKVCIVTGAAKGIGRECALLIARKGAAVVAADLNRGGLNETVADIQTAGGRAAAFVGDMTGEACIQSLVACAKHTYGRLDMVSSNVAATSAAYTARDMALDYGLDYLMETFRINLGGTFLLAKHSIPAMLETGGGAIVCMSSVSARCAAAGHIVYGMTKAALEQLVRGIAGSYGRQGIRANAVEPSMTLTPALLETIPPETLDVLRQGILTPDYTDGRGIAEVVAFLLSDAAQTIQGAVIPADNGYAILPGTVVASDNTAALIAYKNSSANNKREADHV